MMARLLLRSVLGFAAGILALSSAPVLAQPERPQAFDLAYSVHVGGLNMLTIHSQLSLGPDSYDVSLNAGTEGLMEHILSWQSRLSAEGALTEAGVAPERYEALNVWQRKTRKITLTYDENGVVQASAEPPYDRKDAVPEKERLHTVDPTSAVVGLMAALDSGKTCQGKAQVFDGRRRYDLVFADLGTPELTPSSYSLYSGPTTACQITFEPIGGFEKRKKRNSFWEQRSKPVERQPIQVWFATPHDDLIPVPVRVESDSPLGRVVMHLTGLTPVRG